MSPPTAPDFGPNDWYVEEKYQEFLADPAGVDVIWRDFFAQTGSSSRATADIATASASAPRSVSPANVPQAPAGPSDLSGRPPVSPPLPPPPTRARVAATRAVKESGRTPGSADAQRPSKAPVTSAPPAAPVRAGGKESTDTLPPTGARPARPVTTATPDDMVAAKAAKAARAAQDAEGDGLTTTTLRGVAAATGPGRRQGHRERCGGPPGRWRSAVRCRQGRGA